MKQAFNIALLPFIILIAVLLSAKNSSAKKVQSRDDALVWLNKYGYNPCSNTKVQCSLSYSSMLEDYQKRFQLRVTGTLDEHTKKHMNRPRCGIPDKPIEKLTSPAKLRTKWSRSSLNYSLRGYPTQLRQTTTENIIREAFKAWLDHIPLIIEETCSTCPADFVIDFNRADHSDNYPFDGSGGTLAHAFFPENGRVHFDKDETWTERFDDANINLYLVAVHEIGHALGLDHTFNQDSIMYPSYQVMAKDKILPQPDRADIQGLYGRKGSSAVTPTTTRSTSTTKTAILTRRTSTTTKTSVTASNKKSHSRCRIHLDAAIDHPEGTLHTFLAGSIRRYSPNGDVWEQQTFSASELYPRLPGDQVQAGVYHSQKKEVVFFTSTHVYYYTVDHENQARYKKEDKLPTSLKNSVVGALYYNNQIHVITRTKIRLFEPDNRFKQFNPRHLTEKFRDFTAEVKTAFSYKGLHHLFTPSGLVYVWDDGSSKWKTFGQPMESNWFACSEPDTYSTNNIQVTKSTKHRSSQHHHHRHHHHHD